ncbi:hypothetical protein D4A92_24105 (plasmid) [Rhizobium rosettiformans]|uniref:Uncharacterized protein n=1 Tax=Rhizobium rosettiformans TaxID=1368430 RepID=A0ABX7F2D2_9HYPH|nr:hypothetical protein D4A92_24105 [Rhizobium rosettiformans]
MISATSIRSLGSLSKTATTMCCWVLSGGRSAVHQAFLMVQGMAAYDRGLNDSKIDGYSIGRLICIISRCQAHRR